MRKLRLDVDALRVESFVPDAAPNGGGTVLAHSAHPVETTVQATTAVIVVSWERDCYSVLTGCATCGTCTGASCLVSACGSCDSCRTCYDC